MADAYISEIKIVSFNFPPKGWAFCNGQLLPINQNQALFALLGTTYGGDGRTTFALPNLQGRVPIHMGNGYTEGQRGGETAHTLTQSEMPQHIHGVGAVTAQSTTNVPASNTLLSTSAGSSVYAAPQNLQAMDETAVSTAGGSQPHENMQPYLVLNFIICLQGIFPSRN